MLHVGGDRLQALQILWVAEFPCCCTSSTMRATDCSTASTCSGSPRVSKLTCAANPVGLIQQAGRTLRPVAAGDQRVHAVTADQGDGQGQRQNGGEAEGQL